VVAGHGGLPEMVGDAGIVMRMGPQYHQRPYTKVPAEESLQPIVAQIEALFDDAAYYADMSARALQVARSHRLEVSTRRLVEALEPLVRRRAGDADTGSALRQWHRHGLDDRLLRPEQAQAEGNAAVTDAAGPESQPA
jgi:hypothetical protein